MKKRTTSLPVLVVVAVVALVLGSFGTAVGAPAMTKSKVKKIATKVVKKEAPTLSVAHAKTADTATNATNAANAANAAALNGLPGSAYQERATSNFTPDLTSVALPSSVITQLLAPVNLTVPAGVNFVHVTASTGLLGAGAANAALWVMIDGACANSGTGYQHRGQFSVDTNTQSGTTQGLFPVTAGVHSYRLCAVSSGAAATAYGSSLVAETVATGSTGTSAPRPGAGTSDATTP